MHVVNREMLLIWEGYAPLWFAIFLVSFCLVGLCFMVTSDGCLLFGCLSGMETIDVGYVYFVVGLCCGWTSEEYMWWDVYWKFLLYEQYSLLI
ncbi:pyrophosphate--fructose 6-phosphate 1-phosphotransferase subunit alpha isoform X2 [Iris pallida]|uniref:Pyrophosphate--fructose 6-phosphate 1-phosphotransferase subunit alpha isoform X2 n=1 Tax=Iris pallida TaxID=29817 RepID=A0AAX6E8P0_IRIPA|nr:pyrophosphate--fructose 6-phosphate 1-phosphotransferase subunit alpha isoform X2 [Iris pallida]